MSAVPFEELFLRQSDLADEAMQVLDQRRQNLTQTWLLDSVHRRQHGLR